MSFSNRSKFPDLLTICGHISLAAWAPYFDDVNAIIFLAPISGFDQTLADDPLVNRLVRGILGAPCRARRSYAAKHPSIQEDSLMLWKAVCSNSLLSKVELVLFLNKCDILKVKLESGVR